MHQKLLGNYLQKKKQDYTAKMRISLVKFLIDQNLPSTAEIEIDDSDLIRIENGKTKIKVILHTDGNISYFQFFKNGEYHRQHELGPACQTWYENGQAESVIYEKNGKRHRPHELGPAFQTWYENGQTECIAYEENGYWHRPRELGPAYQSWHPDGQLEREEYWENGAKIYNTT